MRKNRLNPKLVLKNASKFDKILRELKEVLELAETFTGRREKPPQKTVSAAERERGGESAE